MLDPLGMSWKTELEKFFKAYRNRFNRELRRSRLAEISNLIGGQRVVIFCAWQIDGNITTYGKIGQTGLLWCPFFTFLIFSPFICSRYVTRDTMRLEKGGEMQLDLYFCLYFFL